MQRFADTRHSFSSRRPSGIRVAALVAAALFFGCADDDEKASAAPDFDERSVALYAFDDCDDLLDYFQLEANAALDLYGGIAGGGVDLAAERGAPEPPQAAEDGGNTGQGAGGEADPDFSGTNVQVAGVDEPDVIKTDGRYVYVTRNGWFLIYDADDLAEVSRTQLERFDAQLLIDGDQAVVLSSTWGEVVAGFEADAPERQRQTPKTELRVFDITDRAAPALVRTVTLEGYLLAARLSERTVRAVVNYDPSWNADAIVGDIDVGRDAPPAVSGGGSTGSPGTAVDVEEPSSDGESTPGGAPTPEAQFKADGHDEDPWIVAVRAAIADSSIEDWVPRIYDVAGDQRTSQSVACQNFHRPGERAGFGVSTVFSIDLDRPTHRFEDPAVVTNAGLVYASGESLYLTTSNHVGVRGGVAISDGGDVAVGGGVTEPGEAVAEPAPEPTEGMATDRRESELRVADERQATQIHKLSIGDPDAPPSYRMSGRVFGFPLNQFSLDEHEGALRIATTERRVDDSENVNHLFVLVEGEAEGDPSLEVVGQVTDLAEGERIYAARFIGDRGFLVTFREVDPLFTLDLSDPSNPIKVGELKIPGFSTYLHPFGEEHLIGIGQAATEEGRVTGMQLSLFDVSDFADPQLAHKHELGQGWSEALYNHHAFTFWQPESLLMVPINAWEDDQPRQGLELFTVSEADGFAPAGTISHDDLAGGWAEMQRSLVIGDAIYSLSGAGMKVNAIDGLAERGSCVFPEGEHRHGHPDGGGREPTPTPAPDLPPEEVPDEGGEDDGPEDDEHGDHGGEEIPEG